MKRHGKQEIDSPLKEGMYVFVLGPLVDKANVDICITSIIKTINNIK